MRTLHPPAYFIRYGNAPIPPGHIDLADPMHPMDYRLSIPKTLRPFLLASARHEHLNPALRVLDTYDAMTNSVPVAHVSVAWFWRPVVIATRKVAYACSYVAYRLTRFLYAVTKTPWDIPGAEGATRWGRLRVLVRHLRSR